MCELLEGLPEVRVFAVEEVLGEPPVVHVEQAAARPWCHRCDGPEGLPEAGECRINGVTGTVG